MKLAKDGMKEKAISFRLGELFCGPGGMALGAIRSSVKTENGIFKIEHAWANDYDSDTCDTYRKNICPGEPDTVHCADVKKLDIGKLGKIDAFAFGFPCNDFSIVGESKGFKGKFGPLYTFGVNVLERYSPKFFVAENVGGLVSANEGRAFVRIVNDLALAGDGYKLTAHLFKFEQYGVPQARHRVIIVGIRRDQNLEFKIPAPLSIGNRLSAREAIENPPIATDAFNNELTSQSPKVIERLSYIKPGENIWNAKMPSRLRLNVKSARLSQIYKRLDPNKPSYTITGSGGGGTHGYHWAEPRALTNRERARIQTFPDNYVFMGSKESVRKQIGMAVSPAMSKIIFEAVLKTFAGMRYKSVESNIKIPGMEQLSLVA